MSRRMAVTGGKPTNGGDHDQARRWTPEYVVDVEKGLVTVRFSGKLSLAQIQDYAKSLRANPSFRSTFSEIADLTGVKELDLGAEDFLKLADESDPFSHDAKRAFVARGATQNHAARMHKILRGQRNFEIFPTVHEAEQWIGG